MARCGTVMKGVQGALEMLNPKVRALISEKGWDSLTPIQENAIPRILEGANTLIVAPTGEGKTEAALLPILSMMLEEESKPVTLLYITPMKALINDLFIRINWWASKLGFRVARKHGDTSIRERNMRLRSAPHILVTTPESLEIDLDWARKFRSYYANLKYVIVDEIHELLSSKRGAQFAIQMERLSRIADRDIQRIGISATIGDLEKALRILAGSSRRNHVIVDSERVKKPIYKVIYIEEKGDPWPRIAKRIVDEIEKPSLVFVNSRYVAEKIKESLESMNVSDVFVHHSSIAAEIREKAEDKLRKGELSAIVCTKTLEVGIDVGDIKKVIQVKSPGRVTSLLQRVGRSGHSLNASPRGSIITLGPLDYVESLAEAQLSLEGRVEPIIITRLPYDVIAKEIAGIIMERGDVTEDELYDIISSTGLMHPSREEFHELIEYMKKNGILRMREGKLRLGSTFYKIWQFKNGKTQKAWWARDFREFFSTIPEKDSFMVKYGDTLVGFIDSIFVYRYLRIGDTIRIAGRSWVVKRIDDNMAKVEVEPTDATAEVPIWRGEGPRRSSDIVSTIMSIIQGTKPLSTNIERDVNGDKIVDEYRKFYSKILNGVNLDTTIILENYNGESIAIGPFGSGVSETLAVLITYLLTREYGLNVYYRASPYGFSIGGVDDVNLDEILRDLAEDPNKVYDLIIPAVKRSPYIFHVIREIQMDFGKIGSIDPDEDEFIINEAARQVIEQYLDIEETVNLLYKIKRGDIIIAKPVTTKLTPLSQEVLRNPATRPWMQDLAIRIARNLEENALTVIELADILELAEKTIDTKIKDMRKPRYGNMRVIGFIDIDENEWRWTLLKDLEYIAELEEFENSFKPINMDEPLRISIKQDNTTKPKEIIVTPRVVVEQWEEIEQSLPDEIYMVRIESAYNEGTRDDIVVTHYYVPRQALRLLILNASAYIQNTEMNMVF